MGVNIFYGNTLHNRNGVDLYYGKSKTNVKPGVRHSEFTVNLAGTMAVFLFKSYSEKKGNF